MNNDTSEIQKIAHKQSRVMEFILRAFPPKRAEYALAILSFLESSFLPIIADPFLVGAVVLHRDRWLRYTIVVVVSSVLGAIFAYMVALLFWDIFGASLLSWLGAYKQFEEVRLLLDRGVVIFTLIGAITPVPYKLVALAGGVFKIDFVAFVLASLVGRFIRFVAVGYITHLGRRYADYVARFISWRWVGIIGAIITIGIATVVFLR